MLLDEMKLYITKYALASGIKEIEGEISKDDQCVNGRGLWGYFHGEGREWHRTREAAIARAEDMRKAKLQSLKRAIYRLENMTFE